MHSVDALLSRQASRQLGIVTRLQALELGLSEHQVDRRVTSDLLVSLHRGVYRAAASPTTPHQVLLAACLAAGHGAVASHRSAAELWELRDWRPARAEITFKGRHRPYLDGVRVHRTDTLDEVDVTVRGGVPVTTVTRTLVDLGAVMSFPRVESALDDALLRDLVSLKSLGDALERLGGSGRRGVATLRSLLLQRDPVCAPTESQLESSVLRLLRSAGLPLPRCQYVVELGSGRSVRIDFAYPHIRLGIEADGRRWHSSAADTSRDRVRGNLLLGAGWRILHFGWAEVRERPELIVDTVARALKGAGARSLSS